MCIETLNVIVYAYNISTEGKNGQDSLGYRMRCFCKNVINNFKTISRIQRNIGKLHAQQSSTGFLRFTITVEDDLDPQFLSTSPML